MKRIPKPAVSVKTPTGPQGQVGNAEATRIDRESVETVRGVLVEWNNLRAIYAEAGTYAATAVLFGCSTHKVQNEIRRQGLSARPRGRAKGYKQDEAWHKAHQAAMLRPEVKQKYRDNLLKRLPTLRGPSANSPLEKLLHSALIKAKVSFVTQQVKLGRYVVDIELRQQLIIIEADGALHRLPQTKARDAVRDAALTEAGYRVFRFNGTEINRDPDGCIRQVVLACGLTLEAQPTYDVQTAMRGLGRPAKYPMLEMPCPQCGTPVRKRSAGKLIFCNMQCRVSWLKANPPDVYTLRWHKNMTQADPGRNVGSAPEMSAPAP